MSKLSQTMKMVSGSTTYQIPFYTTTGEAGAYETYGTANVGGTTCYYGLGTGADAAHGSGVKTPQKVIKSNTTYYMLTKGNAELATYTLKLSATTNQTITLKYKNRNATDTGYETEVTKTSTSSAQSFTVRKGTTWTATIAGASGYAPGALSPGASGTVNAATTVSASAAVALLTITFSKNLTSGATFTVTYTNSTGVSTTSGSNPSSVVIRTGTKITIKNSATSSWSSSNYIIYINMAIPLENGDTWTSGSLSSNQTYNIYGYLQDDSGGA